MNDERFTGTIGIIGAGAKGRQIAAYAVVGRCRVILDDVSESRLAEAKSYITAALGSEGDMLANCFTTQSINDASRADDFLIDAAPDDMESQLEIFTIFDKFSKPGAVLASTAESIPIADLAEMTNCPERCVGLQFAGVPSPPASQSAGALLGLHGRAMRIVRAPQTSERTIEICDRLARTLGFRPVIVSEAERAAAGREGETR